MLPCVLSPKRPLHAGAAPAACGRVVEDILIPIMYEIPSDPTITRVTIDADTVNGGQPHLEYGAVRKRYKNKAIIKQ